MTIPRVRFAPSPTGYLHVGGARTALFNYLFARHSGGAFLLRIEDTDRERSSSEMTGQILDAIAWLGLEVDEPPVHQADGLERHQADVASLLRAGRAYRCFAAQEELEVLRAKSRRDVTPFRYRSSDAYDEAEAERRAAAGEPHAVFFEVPAGDITFDDAVHGPTTVPGDSLDDFVILRSDRTPVYNMAVVSDDVHMAITHVIRGDDHLSNTPKQILIYEALAADLPVFAHVPMILGPDGKRLSKRHGAASVEAYRDEGILPEAMVNFLALLGWSPGHDRELMRLPELIEAFTLDRILKKAGVFDSKKLEWLNGKYLDAAATERLVPLVLDSLDGEGRSIAAADPDRFAAVVNLQKTRARTVPEVGRASLRYLVDPLSYDEASVEKHWLKEPQAAREILSAERDALAAAEPFDAEALEGPLRAIADDRGLGFGKVIGPLRVALLGVQDSPGIFDVMTLLGRDRCIERIDRALSEIERIGAS
ncbi:MAG: glutamate--tRNA ligase [Candidatus Palauibacterales bacterium]|nr:glutamate--tRNA ligase [Candidatus Palauibacterales bacterium]MDP2482348.1 glutamate--tRNA ligase [Candidatus Palauibacterales bacterium]